MADFFFWLLVVLVGAGVCYALWKPARMFEYPAFMAFAFAAFILPQAISLSRFPGAVDAKSVGGVMLMSCLCVAACFGGYFLNPNVSLLRWTARPVDLRKLFHVGIFFIVVSFLLAKSLASTEVQFTEGGGMTGRGTILLFFQQLSYPGFAICLFCAVRRPTVVNIIASVVGLLPLLEAVVIGRREGTALVALIVLMAFYFERKWVPPRWLFAVGLVGAMLVIPATGTYRQLASEKGISAIRDIDFIDNFKKFAFEESPILELRNGAAVIESARSAGRYEYGAGYWNHLVFRFVPAQLVGRRFKDAISIGQASDFTEEAVTGSGFEMARGSTQTGMADTFQQFGWFGCLFFAFMAVVFKSLWQAAQQPEALFAKLLYVLSCTSGMRAVTHWTADFLPGLLYFIIFLGIAMFYAAVPPRALRQRPVRRPPHALTRTQPDSNKPA